MIDYELNSQVYQNSVRYFQIASPKQQAYAILFSYRMQNYTKLSNCANYSTDAKGFLKFFRIDNKLRINEITTKTQIPRPTKSILQTTEVQCDLNDTKYYYTLQD